MSRSSSRICAFVRLGRHDAPLPGWRRIRDTFDQDVIFTHLPAKRWGGNHRGVGGEKLKRPTGSASVPRAKITASSECMFCCAHRSHAGWMKSGLPKIRTAE